MRARLDLTGCTFGNLTAIEPAENLNGRTAWLCRCECGNKCVITTKDLRCGKRTTCGCRRRGLESLHYVDGTCIEMLQNKTVRSNNKSGVTGVFFENKSKKWRAEIMLQGKRIYLGKFSDLSDAIEARLTAEDKIHDEFVSAYWKDNSDRAPHLIVALEPINEEDLLQVAGGMNASFENEENENNGRTD